VRRALFKKEKCVNVQELLTTRTLYKVELLHNLELEQKFHQNEVIQNLVFFKIKTRFQAIKSTNKSEIRRRKHTTKFSKKLILVPEIVKLTINSQIEAENL
jgi:hypothetical protein